VLKIKGPARLEPETYETIWIGDDAVDAAASDADRWCETGDPVYLVLRTDAEAATIAYRPLTDREVSVLPRSEDDLGVHPLWFLEAARYGVISVRGVGLRRRRHSGVVGLSDDSLDALAAHRHPIPLALALWSLHSTGERPASVPIECSLAEWIGVRVLAATFRGRR